MPTDGLTSTLLYIPNREQIDTVQLVGIETWWTVNTFRLRAVKPREPYATVRLRIPVSGLVILRRRYVVWCGQHTLNAHTHRKLKEDGIITYVAPCGEFLFRDLEHVEVPVAKVDEHWSVYCLSSFRVPRERDTTYFRTNLKMWGSVTEPMLYSSLTFQLHPNVSTER